MAKEYALFEVEFTITGTVLVEAEDDDDAREMTKDLLYDNDIRAIVVKELRNIQPLEECITVGKTRIPR